MKKPGRPDESELLAFLDEELTPQRQAEIRQQLAADWELRAQLAKLERRVEHFVDATSQSQANDEQIPLDDLWRDFSARMEATAVRPFWQARLALNWRSLQSSLRNLGSPELRWRLVVGAAVSLIVASFLWIFLWQAARPVSAQELLQRTTQAEAASLRRVGDPVVYRKIQIKRSGIAEPVFWESWNDAQRKQFRQRIADKQGVRFIRANETGSPAIIDELERILRINQFDPLRPLSALGYSAWRKSIQPKLETVSEIALLGKSNDGLKLTTIAQEPYAAQTIAEASLVVRKSDWHAVTLLMKVQSEQGLQEYELSEMSYEVLPLQALTIFSDVAPPTINSVSPTTATTPAMTPSLASASPSASSSVVRPTTPALQEAEVAAWYVLHQLKADLGEQIEVVRENEQRIVVRGLVQAAARKNELQRALSQIAFVSAQIQTIDEAIQKTSRTPTKPAVNETVIATNAATNDDTVTSIQPTVAVNPFQQKLIEQFGGRKGLNEVERAEINARVSQFYNEVEADVSAALADALALRRLQERFVITTALDAVSRSRLTEMQTNHLARLRQRSRQLQTRMRPLLLSFVGDTRPAPSFNEITPPAQLQTVFRSSEQIRRLTDQLIAGVATTSLPAVARALLTEFARLDAALTALEK